MRSSSDVIIYLDSKKALEGLSFHMLCSVYEMFLST